MRPLPPPVLPLVLAVALVAPGRTARAQAPEFVPLSDERIAKAIADGARFRSRHAYLEQGTRANACKVAGLFAMDGISKEIRFFSDYDVVAAAAAAANGEMRRFSADDAKKLPLTGALLGNVQMTGRGMYPVRRLQEKYASRGVHLVVQLGDSIVQPLEKGTATATAPDAPTGVLFTWYNVGNTSVLTGIPLGFQSSHVQQEFAFPVAPGSLPDQIKAYLIDADGDRKEITCRVGALRDR